jgi:hypothetical protein
MQQAAALAGGALLHGDSGCAQKCQKEAMQIVSALADALKTAAFMFWEVLWPLILGFGLSAMVQALVTHRALSRLLGDDSPRSFRLTTCRAERRWRPPVSPRLCQRERLHGGGKLSWPLKVGDVAGAL